MVGLDDLRVGAEAADDLARRIQLAMLRIGNLVQDHDICELDRVRQQVHQRAVVGGGLIAWRWSALLTATRNEELAYASGLDPRQEQLILTVCLAIMVAVAIKVVGVLLIAAMLIIPAAAVRCLARTPKVMAAIAAGIRSVAAILGLQGAYLFDTPAVPSVVCVATLIFTVLNADGSRWRDTG